MHIFFFREITLGVAFRFLAQLTEASFISVYASCSFTMWQADVLPAKRFTSVNRAQLSRALEAKEERQMQIIWDKAKLVLNSNKSNLMEKKQFILQRFQRWRGLSKAKKLRAGHSEPRRLHEESIMSLNCNEKWQNAVSVAAECY